MKLKGPKRLILVFIISSAIPYLLNLGIWTFYFLKKSVPISYLSSAFLDLPFVLFSGCVSTIIIYVFSFLDKRILNKWNVVGFVLYSFVVYSRIYGIAAIIFIASSLVFEIIITNISEWVKKFKLNKYLYWIIVCMITGFAISIIIFSAYVIVVLQMNVASNMFTQQIINNAGGTIDWSKLIK